MSKKIQDLKGCRIFEQQRHCTFGKPGHFHSGKPKLLWLHKKNERKRQHWLVPLAPGLKQPKRKTERVGYSPQTPFIWESRLPGTKPGNGWTFPSKRNLLPAQVLTCLCHQGCPKNRINSLSTPQFPHRWQLRKQFKREFKGSVEISTRKSEWVSICK